MSEHVAFVGLGNMGTPMAGHLLAAGFAVTGFDLDAERRAELQTHGGTSATTAADAVRGADVVVLMLPGSRVVESVLRDPEVRSALAPGALVVDMSSSEPVSTVELAAELRTDGIRMVDAPVSGGVGGARSATLTIMAGGQEADVDAARPVLETLGRVVTTGGVGSGHAVKALNNLMSATHLWITAEVMTAGERFGLDPRTMLDVFNASSGRSGSTQNKWPNFVLPGTFDSGFGLRLMLKDMRIAADLARAVGVDPRLADDAIALWAEAAQALPATADHTRVAVLPAQETPAPADRS
jgi:3-hydroxyisobutyrate dehydrogenase